jgi:hypothetical protein
MYLLLGKQFVAYSSGSTNAGAMPASSAILLSVKNNFLIPQREYLSRALHDAMSATGAKFLIYLYLHLSNAFAMQPLDYGYTLHKVKIIYAINHTFTG